MKGRISWPCRKMVKKAADYIAQNSVKEANILIDTFNEIAAKICKNPEIGGPYKDGLRKIKLGKFQYNIFYEIMKNAIYFVVIWSMKRGKVFVWSQKKRARRKI
jgi:plasmid stabilization system protein ParE